MNLPEPSAEASAFPKFLDAFFAWYYQTFPVNATFIGVHDYDHQLPHYSERGNGAPLAGLEPLRARARVLRPPPLPQSQALAPRLGPGLPEIPRRECPTAPIHPGAP